MRTIASLTKNLTMAAEEAVEVLRKLQYDVADVHSEIDTATVDLLLDIDEDRSIFEKKLKDIEKKQEQERQKQQKKEEEQLKKKVEADAKAAVKAAAKAKAAAKVKAKPKVEAKPKVAAKPKAKAKATADIEPDIPEEAQPVTGTEEEEAAVIPDEEIVLLPEIAGEEDVPEAIVPPPPQEDAVDETPPESAAEDAVKAMPTEAPEAVKEKPHAPRPIAEIVVESEEERLAEIERLESRAALHEGQEGSGALAQAEKKHEEDEKRRQERQKKTQEPQGPKLSPIQADPDVLARVLQRDAEKKRRAMEALTRRPLRPNRPPSEQTTSQPPIGVGPPKTNTPRPPVTGETTTPAKPKKKVKRAERARLREDGMRREAAAAVKEFQAGAVFGGTRKRRKKKNQEMDNTTPEGISGGTIEVEEEVTVEGLAGLMGVTVSDVILAQMEDNILLTKNQTLDMEMVRNIAEKFNFEVKVLIPEEESLFTEDLDNPEDLLPRPPVVTVMGHVDHGKTSLLDAIRSTKVAEGEAGGITQHIAAYDIEVRDGRVTFLDTPGHQAFTQMRARGAHVTDVVVLVVAANDGVKPQTVEAIDHAKAAEVPIVVAINKCDLANAQPDRVRQELTQYGLLDEAWGGKTIMKNISAKMKQGVDELMEMLVLQTEFLELKANPKKRAKGAVIEAELSTGLGPVAWVLVQNGTLRVGDAFLAGSTYGRVRTMTNCRGEEVQEAGPSTPVVVTGFSATADAGDTFIVTADERVAREIAAKRTSRARVKRGPAARHMTLEDFHARFAGQEQKVLYIIIKGDVQGSVDVLKTSFAKLGNSEVSVNVVHAGVGGVTESDVLLAEASDAVIIGFHVTANAKVKKMAEQVGVEIRSYRIIYEALEEVRSALEGMLTPDTKEVVLGHAEVRSVFSSSALGNIAGCYQTDGESSRGSSARLVRDGVVIHEGKIFSLRRHKDDVKLVATGFECGIKMERYDDIRVGDVIESYKMENVAKLLVQDES